jgi:hypothetical protein
MQRKMTSKEREAKLEEYRKERYLKDKQKELQTTITIKETEELKTEVNEPQKETEEVITGENEPRLLNDVELELKRQLEYVEELKKNQK